VPRLGICRTTHGGVKFRRGSVISEIRPGLFWWWPLVTEVEVIATARQTLNLPAQRLTTKDGVSVVVAGVVVYTIRNVVQALTANWDHDATIGDISLAALARHIAEHRFRDLLEAQAGDGASSHLTKLCHADLSRPYGVNVERFFISDFARARVYAFSGDRPLSD
jgi:regulator of protease activity HflC (stomatin/prohibitin superfamily)